MPTAPQHPPAKPPAAQPQRTEPFGGSGWQEFDHVEGRRVMPETYRCRLGDADDRCRCKSRHVFASMSMTASLEKKVGNE